MRSKVRFGGLVIAVGLLMYLILVQQALAGALGASLLEGRQTGLSYDCSNLAAVNFNSTLSGIETADVVLLLLDATQGVSDQDAHIAGSPLPASMALANSRQVL